MHKPTLLLFAVLLAVLLAGCGPRATVLEERHIDLRGYAYDRDLNHIGEARLEMDLEVYDWQRSFRSEPIRRVRGEGRLTVGSDVYRVAVGPQNPEDGAHLDREQPPCKDYYEGGLEEAVSTEDLHHGLQLNVSEDLTHAYGMLHLDGSPERAQAYPIGHSSICFDDEGKTVWEIWNIKGTDPVIAFTLGEEASPLEKLQAHRKQVTGN